MFSWILALVLALLVWCLSSAYLWLVQRRNTEASLGVSALAGMHWRDFSRIVRRAMSEQRGMQDMPTTGEDHREPSSDFLMLQNGQPWLLSCKHGRAYRIGSAAVNELGSALRLAGARGGILITEGKVQRDGLVAAEKQSIEVLDARHLWPFLKPYVPAEMESQVTTAAQREAQRRIGIAALASLTLGLLVGMGYLTSHTGRSELAAEAPLVPAAAAPADTATVMASDEATPATPTAAVVAAQDLLENPDDETLKRYQQAVSKALARTPGITSGIWLTRLTLAVDRTGDDDATWPLICKEVQRYPALRTVRIQLNPRPGTNEPVRWRQCSTI
ncbi:restriction endonuclease [Stenotrophomonas sp. YIM B06876]|uniref:restriction endonuclease n=1 Tax=Stenotrophomonas sp. YIM B06876 TaxID=3060211 RepID=UPI002739DA16|nr:restriction endonuclease [Stenotrophomonas sp. YIM B06876]